MGPELPASKKVLYVLRAGTTPGLDLARDPMSRQEERPRGPQLVGTEKPSAC